MFGKVVEGMDVVRAIHEIPPSPTAGQESMRGEILDPPLPVVLGATALVGVGWGLYVSVDLAVLTAVLPDESTRATMLGIGNVAAALPQVLAPVVAAPLVTSAGGYPLLYGVTAGLAVAALAGVRLLRVP